MTAFWVSYTNLSVTGNSSHTAAAVCCLRKETAPSAQTEERLGILGKRKFKIGLQVLLLVINVLFWETGHLVQRKIHPDSPERTFQCALWQSLSYPCPSRNRISFPCSNRLLNSSNTNSSAAALQPVAVCKLCYLFLWSCWANTQTSPTAPQMLQGNHICVVQGKVLERQQPFIMFAAAKDVFIRGFNQ